MIAMLDKQQALIGFAVVVLLAYLWKHKQIAKILPDIKKDPVAYLLITVTMVLGILGLLGIIVAENVLISVTLTVLSILAVALKYNGYKQNVMLNEIRALTSGASAVRTFTRWNDRALCDVISNARKSITIVDSHCREGHFLATRAQEAIENGTSKLTVSVYMLDPTREFSFGAQRLLEKRKPKERKTKSADDLRDGYTDTFITDCNNIREAISKVKDANGTDGVVNLEIYKYSTMPSLRAIIVDDSEYIFGWFPLNDVNPNHACFFLSASSILTKGDRAAVRCLEHHIKEIKEEALPVPIKNEVTQATLSSTPQASA